MLPQLLDKSCLVGTEVARVLVVIRVAPFLVHYQCRARFASERTLVAHELFAPDVVGLDFVEPDGLVIF